MLQYSQCLFTLEFKLSLVLTPALSVGCWLHRLSGHCLIHKPVQVFVWSCWRRRSFLEPPWRAGWFRSFSTRSSPPSLPPSHSSALCSPSWWVSANCDCYLYSVVIYWGEVFLSFNNRYLPIQIIDPSLIFHELLDPKTEAPDLKLEDSKETQ